MNRWSFFIFLFSISFTKAQEEIRQKPNNQLENTDSSLIDFRQKIKQLSTGEINKVSILHIGDSHVQPDNFTGETRRQIQKKYGNGGRGLAFPYSLAKTNGPKDFTITSNVEWSNSWNINYPHKFKLGLAGMGVQSLTTAGEVTINLVKDTLTNPYKKAFVIYSMDNPTTGKITLNHQVTKTGSKADFDTVTILLPIEQTELSISFSGSKLTIHGVHFENAQKGIVYNSAGVAGARYQEFNGTEFFFKQFSLLSPDLMIISLGTNESFDPKYDENKFATDVDTLISRIRRKSPGLNIILTLPSENYRVRQGIPNENKTITSVSAVIRAQAIKHNCAIWDLYAAMGGKGSMLAWHKEGLVNKDHIHFLRPGYRKQGVLLFEAIQLQLEGQ
jgi:lysophospholipase L1-like esterase